MLTAGRGRESEREKESTSCILPHNPLSGESIVVCNPWAKIEMGIHGQLVRTKLTAGLQFNINSQHKRNCDDLHCILVASIKGTIHIR